LDDDVWDMEYCKFEVEDGEENIINWKLNRNCEWFGCRYLGE